MLNQNLSVGCQLHNIQAFSQSEEISKEFVRCHLKIKMRERERQTERKRREIKYW